MTEQESVQTPNNLTQLSYKETAYADSKWEILGEFGKNEFFVPVEFEILPGTEVQHDKMFADYGGRIGQAETTLPHASEQDILASRQVQDEDAGSNLVSLTPEDLEAQLAEAYKAGFEAASEQVKKGSKQEIETINRRFETLTTDLNQQFNEKLDQVRNQALDLTLAISGKIISFAVDIKPEYINEIILNALGQAGSAKIKRVRVSPEDMEFISIIGVNEALKKFEGAWSYEADSSIKSGCVVDTSAGEIDFQLDKAWQRVCDKVVSVTRGSDHGV